MTTWIRSVCETNGISLRYLRTGGGRPPVVLLHGLLGSGACWTPLARALEGEFDVVMPDARGHGGSSVPHHGYRYDDHANDVVGLIRGLELSRPILLGHSMGGMTAAVLASRGAGILRGLVLVDPTFLSPERQREVRDSDVADQHRQALGPVVTLEMATELRSLNPRVRIEQIQNAGHGLPFEQPDRLGEVVASFLRELA